MSVSVGSSTSATILPTDLGAARTEAAPVVPVVPSVGTPAGVGATPSTFDTAAGSGATTDAPVRNTEVASLLSTPEKVPAADCVREETKVDTIVQAALPTERESVRAHFEKAEAADLDAAFTNVLKATQTAGVREVELGPFKGSVSVDERGRVNGASLPSDRELAVTNELANLSQADRREQLRQVGVDEAFLATASETQLVRAFNEVELTRRFGEPGEQRLSIEYVGQRSLDASAGESSSGAVERFDVRSTIEFKTGPGGTVAAAGQALARPTSETALRELSARELAEWPAGRPETRSQPAVANESVKLATLVSYLEPAKAKEVMASRQFITDQSINAAYDRLLEETRTPGPKTFSFELDASKVLATGPETEAGPSGIARSPVEAFRLSASLDVGAAGQVNGKPLLADEVVRLANQTAHLPGTVKDLLLKDAGVSSEWLDGAAGEKDLVLAQLRLAAKTPGDHLIDLHFNRVDGAHTESGGTAVSRAGSITISVDSRGQVNGKPLLADAAIATHATMDRLPMAEKRLMLAQLGIPAEAVRGVRAFEATEALTTVAMLTTSPGDHSFTFGVNGKPWQMGVRVGERGAIEGVGAQRIPEQSFGREFFDFACTVVSVAFPAFAPIVAGVRAAVAYEQGQRGLGMVALAAQAFAGGAGMADVSWASTAADIARVATAVNGTYQAAKTGDVLGGFSSIVSLAYSVGDLSGSPIDSKFNLLKTVGEVASGARSLINGDLNGLAGQVFGGLRTHETELARQTSEDVAETLRLIRRSTPATGPLENAPISDPSQYLLSGRLGEARDGTVRLGTGDAGSSLTTGPTGTQSDVRRVDNQLDATRPQTRQDFDRAFAAARRSGESIMTFDMNDGRGPQQYTTGTRQELAAAIPGGSSAQYESIVRQYFGGRDSDEALAAYRNALMTTWDDRDARDLRTQPGAPPTTNTTTAPIAPASGPGVGSWVADQIARVTGNGRGLDFFGPNDSAATGLQHPATRDPNLFVVTGHGNQQHIEDQRVATTVAGMVSQAFGQPADSRVLAEDLANRIRSSAGWDGKSVVLLSCNAGTGGVNSYAQRVANLLGVPVAAGDGYVGSDSNGSQVSTTLSGGRLPSGQQHRGLTWFVPTPRTGG